MAVAPPTILDVIEHISDWTVPTSCPSQTIDEDFLHDHRWAEPYREFIDQSKAFLQLRGCRRWCPSEPMGERKFAAIRAISRVIRETKKQEQDFWRSLQEAEDEDREESDGSQNWGVAAHESRGERDERRLHHNRRLFGRMQQTTNV